MGVSNLDNSLTHPVIGFLEGCKDSSLPRSILFFYVLYFLTTHLPQR